MLEAGLGITAFSHLRSDWWQGSYAPKMSWNVLEFIGENSVGTLSGQLAMKEERLEITCDEMFALIGCLTR